MLATVCARRRITRAVGDTLLPFLYSTKTILRAYTEDVAEKQNCNTPDQDDHNDYKQPWRNPTRSDYVPFEGGLTRPSTAFDGSTITPSEKRAFQSLFKMAQAKETDKDNKSPVEGHDEQTKDLAEWDGSNEADSDTLPRTLHAVRSRTRRERLARERKAGVGLDNILGAAMDDIRARGRRRLGLPEPLWPMAQRARERMARQQKRVEEKKRRTSHGDHITKMAKEHVQTVSLAMGEAKTDMEVWNILQEQVFNHVVALELDKSTALPNSKQPVQTDEALDDDGTGQTLLSEETTPTTAQSSTAQLLAPIDLQVLKCAFPFHLTNTFRVLQNHFPTSPLPLTLIPTLKSFGPSVCALGLTTTLYNYHMQLLYNRYPTDLDSIISTLNEMSREVYQYDRQTLRLLERISDDAYSINRGERGDALKLVWSTERITRARWKLTRLKYQVKEQEMAKEVRRTREREESEIRLEEKNVEIQNLVQEQQPLSNPQI